MEPASGQHNVVHFEIPANIVEDFSLFAGQFDHGDFAVLEDPQQNTFGTWQEK